MKEITMNEFLDKFHYCAEEIQSAVSNIEHYLSELDMICCRTPDDLETWKPIDKKENPELWQMVRSLRSSLDNIDLKSSCPIVEKEGEE